MILFNFSKKHGINIFVHKKLCIITNILQHYYIFDKKLKYIEKLYVIDYNKSNT